MRNMYIIESSTSQKIKQQNFGTFEEGHQLTQTNQYIYRLLQETIVEYNIFLFSNVKGVGSKINYKLSHKTSLRKFRRIENTQSMYPHVNESDYWVLNSLDVKILQYTII